MRKLPRHALWLGHAGDLQDTRAILDLEVKAVVEIADSEPPAVLPRELIHCRFPLSDDGNNPEWLLRLAIDSVARLLRADVPVLVCCSAGISRSVCVASAALSIAEKRPFAETFTVVGESGPADVSPGLFGQIERALERRIAE